VVAVILEAHQGSRFDRAKIHGFIPPPGLSFLGFWNFTLELRTDWSELLCEEICVFMA
ncbi:unnamed protein product, partial [Allacma fusca]